MTIEMIIATILTFAPLFFLRKKQVRTNNIEQASAPASVNVPNFRPFLRLKTRRASFFYLIFFMIIFACYIALYFCLPEFCAKAGISNILPLPVEPLVWVGYALGIPSAVALVLKKGSFTGGITAAVLSQLSLCLLVGNAGGQLTYSIGIILYGATAASFFIIIPCLLRDYFGSYCFPRVHLALAPLWLFTFWVSSRFVSSIPPSYPTYGNIIIFFLITLAFGALFLFLGWQKRFAIVRFTSRRRVG